jgi:hypothetical protein
MNYKSKKISYDNSLFTLRFIGDGFDLHGASIYDLGIAFMTFQRLLNKTFLLTRDRLEKGAFPKRNERQMLAMQIGERRKASDGYGLVPLLTDPTNLQILRFVGEQLMSGLIGYYVQDIMDRLKREESDEKRFYIGSIHAEVVNIVGRIDAAGGIGALEIGAPGVGHAKPVLFTEETKKYVNKLSREHFLGAKQTIRGKLVKMLPGIGVIEIRSPGRGTVKVNVDAEIFDRVRFDKSRSDMLEFVGRPIFPLGAKSQKVYELEASDVRVLESEPADVDWT